MFFAWASEKAYGYTIFKTKHQCPILHNYLRKRDLFPARGNISVSIPTLALRTDSDKFSFITRASVYGTPESENATVFVAKTGVIVPGVPCVDRGNWGRRRYIARSGQNSVFWEESFGKYRALLVHLAYRDTDLFSERVGPRVIILKDSKVNSCLKRTREITNWADRGTDKNRQSMTSCGFCCYYLEHCSKTNHIGIKWTKYENGFGLVASHKIWLSPSRRRKNSIVWFRRQIV